jgi:hypothetical protein
MTTTIYIPEFNIYTPKSHWPKWMRRRDETIVATQAFGSSAAAPTVFSVANMAIAYADAGAATATYQVAVIFRATGDGTLDVERQQGSDILNIENPYCDVPSGCWVRCLYVSGDHMTSGSAEDTWLNCDTQKSFIMTHTSTGGTDFIEGTFDFALSSDASGSPVESSKTGVDIRAGEIL